MPLRKFFLLTCMWHLCASPSVFLPSAIRKVPGETAFLHHLLIPFPQRQHFPRFSAVAAWLFSLRPCCRSSVWPYASVPFPQRQCFPRFGAVAACSFPPAPLLQVFCAALPLRPVSTTAAFPAIRCRCGTTLWKVPTETAFLHHLLEFVISGPVPEASLAGHAREPHPEGAGESAVCPSPSRFGTWSHFTPSEGVAKSRHFPTPSEGVIGPFSEQSLL